MKQKSQPGSPSELQPSRSARACIQKGKNRGAARVRDCVLHQHEELIERTPPLVPDTAAASTSTITADNSMVLHDRSWNEDRDSAESMDVDGQHEHGQHEHGQPGVPYPCNPRPFLQSVETVPPSAYPPPPPSRRTPPYSGSLLIPVKLPSRVFARTAASLPKFVTSKISSTVYPQAFHKMRAPIRNGLSAAGVPFVKASSGSGSSSSLYSQFPMKQTGGGSGSDQPPKSCSIVCADLLIPGRGEPIYKGALIHEHGEIKWVGAQDDLPSTFDSLSREHVPVLMPGLWDCHTHYMGGDVATDVNGEAAYLPGTPVLVGALTAEDLKETIKAGYTSIRECGGYAGDVKPGVEKGALIGPNIYSSHSALSITGGHGDDHLVPIKTVKNAELNGVCDGVDECTRKVREMVRRGASVIKVCSSGGVLSLNDDPEDRQFSDAELSAIVEEAGRSRRAVAAHAIGKAGIMAALRAGVRSIEHGMYLDEEAIELMKEKGTYLVATQHIVRIMVSDYYDTLPEKMQKKLLRISSHGQAAYRLAVKHGVNIALGTDMISSDRKSNLSHGNNAREIVYAVEAGMTPLQAIESATANGPMTLGGLAPKSGQLREGYDADFIAVKKNPLKDVSVLTERENIIHVWKGGKQIVRHGEL